jgi:superfamily II DNA or RNA helicase
MRVPAGPPSSPLREWQERALETMAGWERGAFLLSAAPGAGKTRPALLFARAALAARVARRVVVVCPTSPLTRQWARAAGALGLQLLPDAPRLRPPRDFHGIAVTYARVASLAAEYARECIPATLVIADEAHHLGEDLSWGQGFGRAFAPASRRLLLSGTPFRSDCTPIPGVRYDPAGLAEPDFAYTYAEAIADGICRPVTFVPYDGTLRWQSGEDVIESSFEETLGTREAGRRYRTAISTELPDGLPRILRAAHDRLAGVRSGGHADAGGLVVAADSEHAWRIAAVLREVTGRRPVVVLHRDRGAADKLQRFRDDREPWIVAVNMVSEGVDIPRLRVGVYASAAKTALIFRQIVGRFVRTLAGRPAECSWLFLPSDRLLRSLAADVEDELRPVLVAPGEEDGLVPEAAERLGRERTGPEPAAFVPLDADVAPQLALFGGPGPERASAPPVGVPAHRVAAAEAPVGVPLGGGGRHPASPDATPPAFERRRALRAERHRLVAALRRLTGEGFVEINGRLNRACGVERVERATLEQLERSVELLRRELDRAA